MISTEVSSLAAHNTRYSEFCDRYFSTRNHPQINALRNRNERSITSSGFLRRGCSEPIRTTPIFNFDHTEFETGTGIQVSNSALALFPSRHRAHALLANHKRQRIWFDIIDEVLAHSKYLASSTSTLRATINDYIIIVIGRSKNSRAGWQINHRGRHIGSDGNRIRIRGRTALIFVTYNLGNSRGIESRHSVCETSARMRTCRHRGRSAARSR
jgi:hypothetical protein